jgi:hypothetical protein
MPVRILLVVTLGLLVGCEKKPPPDVDLKVSCVMNGRGEGSCTFTNVQTGVGAQCGVVKVKRDGITSLLASDVFCSGKVEGSSSKKVEFSIPAVQTFCDNPGDSWTKVCEFNFVPEE